MKPSTERRLFQYALSNRRVISIALVCLIIAVTLELTGPLIAKTVIDNHIVGIQSEWAQLETEQEQTVKLQGNYFKRADRLTASDQVLGYYTLVQSNQEYYLIKAQIPVNSIIETRDNEQFIAHYNNQTEIVSGVQLSVSQLCSFFQPEIQPISILLAIYLGLIFISALFTYLKTYLLQIYANQIIQRIRNDVFAKIHELPMQYFIDRPAGKTLAIITNDTEAIKELYVNVLETFINGFVYMAGIYFALFLLNAHLALICLIFIPILYYWIKFYKKYAGKYNRVIRSANSDINASINETIQNMPIIQAFKKTEKRQEEFEQLNNRHYHYQRKMVILEAFATFNLVNLLKGIALVGFIWYFGNGAITNQGLITTGVLYAFVDYLTRLFEPMEMIINQLSQLEQARVSANRVFELLDEPGEAITHEAIPKIEGHIHFHQVSFAYQQEDYILKDVSFDIQAGQTVAFVGHTGSGKSSIMNLLLRFYDQQKGSIKMDDIDIQTLTRQQVRQEISIVLQDPFIFTGTILSNITLNDPQISRDKAITALKTVGADQFIEKLPLKYDQPVGENGNGFSTGQRQLLSFARALAFEPAILILDEATANIDTETERLIQRAIEIIAKGRTMLVIAHRLSTIQHADQIIVMEKGKIIERGKHEELLNQEGNYFKMYKMQHIGITE
ncbi:ABC transporter ATP-binding protein/permease [Amphibacillus sp. MSJ-3]|uniref:ABC transporter ATP-binding protein n=1 Tax=Amphibacillus sp. MSJ-3 TaxID=2841505 RepID=UPI001C0E9528|nr:ABC transporter ATP-binding protein [Amphibacillus sp. MSJ-3]MBU5595486.1 ABC transporter ATP-binding protein/permease [Amphibacillus sp. MSJ-3]